MSITSLLIKNDTKAPKLLPRPKIVIFSCNGGGGHINATKALQEALACSYDIVVFDVFASVFDPLHIISFGKTTATDFYNWCLQKGHTGLVNFLNRFSINIFRLNKNVMKRQFVELLEQEMPSLVISVVPFVNGALADAARECEIPCIIIPTDLDSTIFISGLDARDNSYVTYTVPFASSEILNIVESANIPESQIVTTGFPVRSSFFEPKDISALKEEFGIPQNKFVVMVMMGALGSTASYKYALELAQFDLPLHVIICLGKNEQLRSAILSIPLPDHITLSAIGYTDRIADLMAISDVCISKSGTVSVAEILYTEVPAILDATASVLTWEYFNHPFMVNHGFGVSLKNVASLEDVLRHFITDSVFYNRIKKNLTAFKKKRFADTIKTVVDKTVNPLQHPKTNQMLVRDKKGEAWLRKNTF